MLGGVKFYKDCNHKLFMKRSDKKGLSPVIASVLMVALVLVLAAIVFMWARGFISEQIEKFGQPVEKACDDVSFVVDLVKLGIGYELEIENTGNVPIQNFDIKKTIGGDSVIEKFKFSVNEGDSVKQGIEIGTKTDEVVIYPALLGKLRGKATNKVFTCSERGETVVIPR
jgi:flagellin-like protein